MARIVVIGGGISGLACAREILDQMPATEVTVLEAAAGPGGPVRSERAEGFLCEVGPHGFLNADPSTIGLARRLGLADRLLFPDEARRGRFIFFRGRLHAFPDQPMRFFRSALLSPWGRARVLLEPLLPSHLPEGDESVGSFARRRLGREAAERLIDPLVCGIYGGDMDRLSLAASTPQFAAMARKSRSLVGAALQLTRARPAPAGAAAPAAPAPRRLVSFLDGIGELVVALGTSLGDALECQSPVTGLQRLGERWRVTVGGVRPRQVLADVVIAATPAPAARTLLGPLDGDLERALGSIGYLPAAIVALGFRQEDVGRALGGFGYLVPHVEGGSVLGVLWPSSMFPARRCPDGMVLVQAILGGARAPDICERSDAWLVEQVCAQLRQAIGLRGAPVLSRTYRHRPGLPQYDVGHHARVAAVQAAEARLPGLFITGNAFRGVGINACTSDARKVTTRVREQLARTSEPALHVVSAARA